MIAKTADLFYNSIKDDYAFVKLTKVFLLVVSTMGLYMTSQDYLIEEIDPNTDSSQTGTSPSSRSGSSSTMLLNNAIVLTAMTLGIPTLMMVFSLLSPTQRFSLRDQLIAEGTSVIDNVMNTLTDEIQPSAVGVKHEFVAKALLDLVKTQAGVKRASGLLDSLMQSGLDSNSEARVIIDT